MIGRPLPTRHVLWNEMQRRQPYDPVTKVGYFLLGADDYVFGDLVKIGEYFGAITQLCNYYGIYSPGNYSTASFTLFKPTFFETESEEIIPGVMPIWDITKHFNIYLDWYPSQYPSKITSYGPNVYTPKQKILVTCGYDENDSAHTFHVFEYWAGRLTYKGSTVGLSFPNVHSGYGRTKPVLITETKAVYPCCSNSGDESYIYTNVLDITDPEAITYSGTIPYYLLYKVHESGYLQYWLVNDYKAGKQLIISIDVRDLSYVEVSNKITPYGNIFDGDYAVAKCLSKRFAFGMYADQSAVASIDISNLLAIGDPVENPIEFSPDEFWWHWWHNRGEDSGSCYSILGSQAYRFCVDSLGTFKYGKYDITRMFFTVPGEWPPLAFPISYNSVSWGNISYQCLVKGIADPLQIWFRLSVIDFGKAEYTEV